MIVDQRGQQVAIFGYLVSLPGHGTTPSSLAVELDAVTTSGTLLWSMTTPTRAQPSLIIEAPILTFVGVSGDDAIATVGDDEEGYSTYAFNITSRTVAWVNAQFLAQAVVGGTVLGTYDTSPPSSGLGESDTANLDALHVEAVSAATGKTTWQQAESVTAADIQQASPSTIMTEAIDSASGNAVIWLLHLNTGKGSEIYNHAGQVTGGPRRLRASSTTRPRWCAPTPTPSRLSGSTARQAENSGCSRIRAATGWRHTSRRSSTVTSTAPRSQARSS